MHYLCEIFRLVGETRNQKSEDLWSRFRVPDFRLLISEPLRLATDADDRCSRIAGHVGPADLDHNRWLSCSILLHP